MTIAKLKPRKIETKIKNPKRISQRRMQIIKGAITVFTSKGFHNATVREIAKESGITEGTLYNYISSKEDIIYIVYDYITRILREELEKAIEGIQDPKERLKTALKTNMRTIEKYQDIILFMYKESSNLDKESLYNILARETSYIEMFEGILREYFKSQKIDENKIKISGDLLSYVPVIIAFRRWSLRKRFDSMDDVMELILEFILSGIQFSACEKKITGDKEDGR